MPSQTFIITRPPDDSPITALELERCLASYFSADWQVREVDTTQPLYIQLEDARHQAHYDAALGEVWNPPTLEQLKEKHNELVKRLSLIGKTVTPVSGALWLAVDPITDLCKDSEKACVFTGKGKVLKVEQHVLDYDAYDEMHKDNPDHTPYQIGKLLYTNLLIECDAGNGWAGEGAIKYE